MSQFRGFRDSLRSFVPIWLQDRPAFRNGYKILYVLALLVDVALKFVVEGVYCWYPGYSLGVPPGTQVDASTALPLIGRSRGIIRGQADSDVTFAARLIRWLDDWEAAGSSEILIAQIQAYLGNSPAVRIVDRSGFWVSIDSSGNITTATAAWNWDGTSHPGRAVWWSDLWIIVYPTEWPITGTSLASLVGVWGNNDAATQIGTGHQVPRGAVDVILGLLDTWKGAHCWCEAILWSYDSTLFVPGAPVSGDPDGTWGAWGKVVGGVLVPARTGATDGRVRYWVPANG